MFDVKATVDSLGVLQARIADLKALADEKKTLLIAAGVGAYEGELYRATVSKSERETLDMKAVRAKLSRQFIEAHTTTAESVNVRVVSRTAEKVKAAA